MVKIAALIVVTYAIYMLCHVIQGTLAPDGLLLSGIIAVIAYVAGAKVEREWIYPPEQKE